MSALGAAEGIPTASNGPLGGGGVGQVPTSAPGVSIMPPNTDLGLNPDWLALIMVVSAGVGLGIIFAIVRLVRRIRLRRPIPMTMDSSGTSFPNRSKTRKVISFPMVVIGKISLRSFRTNGVPAVGMILLILLWTGFSLFALLFRAQLILDVIAYRLA